MFRVEFLFTNIKRCVSINRGINSPLDYRYMKLLRFSLRIISGWPGRKLKERTFFFEGRPLGYFMTILALTYLTLGLRYLEIHWPTLDFMKAGHMFVVMFCNLLCVSRAFQFVCFGDNYRSVAAHFIDKMHLFHQIDKSDISRKIHVEVHKFSHFFCVFLYGVFWFTIFFFNATPVYSNYARGLFANRTVNLENETYEHPVYFTLPWNADTNFEGYCVAQVVNALGTFLCGSSILMFDILLSLMIFNLWGHFKILLYKLDNFPKPASTEDSEKSRGTLTNAEMYSETELQMVTNRLKDCIDFHKLIIGFTGKISDAFGGNLVAYYLFHQVSGCLLLLEVSQMTPEALMRYGPMTVILIQQLMQVSIIFENIGTMSEKLKIAVYGLPWEHMDTRTRKVVAFFLAHVQEPVHVKAGAMVNVGVTTMATILKTSFSYFTFLRTVAE